VASVLQFDVLFRGMTGKGTEKGVRLDRDFAAVGVSRSFTSSNASDSSTVLRAALRDINRIGERFMRDAQRTARQPRAQPRLAIRTHEAERSRNLSLL